MWPPEIEAFLRRLPEAPARALLIDYDGTLAPITPDRNRAVPYPGLRSLLIGLTLAPRPSQVWIVSGRTVSDLSRLTRLDRFADLWGSHGLERRTRAGCRILPARSRRSEARLETVRRRLAVLDAGSVLERKRYGLAIHSRGTDRRAFLRAKRELLREFGPSGADAAFELHPFDGGLEVRPRGADKGRVVRAAFDELGRGAAVAYLGDDRTDEDAFRAIRGRGLSVLVRPRRRATRAIGWIRPPRELEAFLNDWTAACTGSRV